jgi:hypothetical protein
LTSTQNKRHYIIYIILIILRFQSDVLNAQIPGQENNINKAKQKTSQTNKRVYPITNSQQEISKTQSNSFKPGTYTVQKKKLTLKYYTNNIFDINETDNPFALPIAGRKLKIKSRDKSKLNFKEIFTELFEKGDDSSSKTPSWLIFALLGFLSYMSILIAIFPKEVKSFFHAFLSTSAARKLQREQAGILKIERFSSYILYVMNMGTFCFLIPQILTTETQFNTFAALLFAIGGVSVVYTLKHIQLKVIALILPIGQEINLYNFIISNTNKVLGYVLTPILFLLLYVPSSAQETVLYFSFILLGVIYLYRSFSGIIIAGSIILFHKFHFIVYLCAIEIAPILISLKLLSIL